MLDVAREYFSRRTGVSNNNPLDDFAVRFDVIFKKFVKEGYFEQMGIAYAANSIRIKNNDELRDKLVLEFGAKGYEMIPTSINIASLDHNSLFDLIEFLADRVSKHNIVRKAPSTYERILNPHPIDVISDLHKYEDTRFDSYDPEGGKKKWREDLNKYLAHLDPPYQLTTEQNIETLAPDGLVDLMDSCASPSDDAQLRIKHACELFLKHSATKADKMSALNELAGVLESVQYDLKKHVKREANELFNIANNYGIRHHRKGQKECDENYLQWIFYSFLSTINLVVNLSSQHGNTSVGAEQDP